MQQMTPSRWVQRWSHLVARDARVLDVACGSGRHLRWFVERGCKVTRIDRDAEALRSMQGLAELAVCDIEAGPWPWPGRVFDAVIVTNYLWRPLLATCVESVAECGVLIFETFAEGQQTIGKPSNPNFLLQPAELLRAAQGLRVVAFEGGFEGSLSSATGRFVQRLVAVREPATTGPATLPPRHLLPP